MHRQSISLVLAFLSAIVLIASAENKCENCKTLVKGILDGLDKTKKKNFEGGDVAWEEKKLGKYKTSETRLVEILETYACSKDNHKCNALLEEKEEVIYEWYNKLQDDMALHDYLCVQEAQVCCPEGTFGEECTECPKGDSGKICYGRGICSGDGDKEGTGECICDEGYGGELCNDCGDGRFETFRNDTYILCSLCHNSCKTCKGNKSNECLTCMDGFRQEENIDNEDELTCVDVNECVENRNLCPVGAYCLNNEGSYSCEAWKCHPFCTRCYGPLHTNCFGCKPGLIMRQPFVCQDCHPACESCFGPGNTHCESCVHGAIMTIPYMCQDIDECASGAICLGMYEVCINTMGHYRCECARYFRRDEATGQCQPDPNIYSRMAPKPRVVPGADKAKKEEKPEEQKEEATEEKSEGEEKKADDAEETETKSEL